MEELEKYLTAYEKATDSGNKIAADALAFRIRELQEKPAKKPKRSRFQRASETFFDMSKGLGAGLVNAPQGGSQGVAIIQDYFENPPVGESRYEARVQKHAEFDEKYGLVPEHTSGKIVEEVSAELANWGLGELVVAGLSLAGGAINPALGAGIFAVGTAANTARRVKPVVKATGNVIDLAQNAKKARTLRAAALARSKTLLRTAGVFGLSQAAFSVEGKPTVSDSFDFMPNVLETEELIAGASGRLAAARAFKNRLRYGAEGALATILFDGGLSALGAGARASGNIPGVSKATRTIVGAFAGANKAMDNYAFTRKAKDAYLKHFTAGGTLPTGIYEDLQDAVSSTPALRGFVQNSIRAIDKAMLKVAKGQTKGGWFKTRKARNMAQDDLDAYLLGADDALKKYPVEVRNAADELRWITKELEDMQIVELKKIYDDASLPRERRNSARDVLFDIRAERKLRMDLDKESYRILGPTRYQMAGHIARSYELFEAPIRYWKNFDPDSPLLKDVVNEMKLKLVDDVAPENLEREAKKMVMKHLHLEGSPDKSWIELAKNKAASLRGETMRPRSVPPGKARLSLDQSSFIKRIELSPSMRSLMKEVTNPKQRVARSVERDASNIAGVRFYRKLTQDPKISKNLYEIDEIMDEKTRPLIVDPDAGAANLPTGVTVERQAIADANRAALYRAGYRELGGEAPELSRDTIFRGAYGDLTGKLVAPELTDALTVANRVGGPLTNALALGTWAKAFSQAMTVVMSPLSHVRNLYGGGMMLGATGNLRRGMNFGQSMDMFLRDVANLNDAGQRRLMMVLGQHGVLDEALLTKQAADMRKGARDTTTGIASDLLNSRWVDHVPVVNAIVNKMFRPVGTAFERAYSGGDSLIKSMATFSEASKVTTVISKAGLDIKNPDHIKLIGDVFLDQGLTRRLSSAVMPEAEWILLHAADTTKQLIPTYPRLAPIVSKLDKIPFIGAFSSFAAESVRTSINTVTTGARQMAFRVPRATSKPGSQGETIFDRFIKVAGSREGAEKMARALEREIRGQGAHRVASYAAVSYAIPSAAAKASQAAVGMSDEQNEHFMSVMPEYQRGHALMKIAFEPGVSVEYVDQSYVNPYAFAQDAARAALQTYSEKKRLNAGNLESIGRGLWAGLSTFVEPFLGESLVAERLWDVTLRDGRAKSGARVFDKDETVINKISKGLNHTLLGFTPGFAREIATVKGGEWTYGRASRAFLEAAGFGMPDGQGRTYDAGPELFRMVSGFTPMKLDLKNTAAEYSTKAYLPKRSMAKSRANKLLKDNSASLPQKLEGWEGYLQDLYRHQSELYGDVLAFRALGMSNAAIRKQLKKGGLGNAEANRIMQGRFAPTSVSDEVAKEVRLEMREQSQRDRFFSMSPFNRMTQQWRRLKLNPRILEERRKAEAAAKVEAAAAEAAAEAAQEALLSTVGSGEQARAPAPTPAPAQAAPSPTTAPPQATASNRITPDTIAAALRLDPGIIGHNPANLDILNRRQT